MYKDQNGVLHGFEAVPVPEPSAFVLLVAALASVAPIWAVAQEQAPVAHPEQLGFSTPRLQRLTQAYQGYVDRGELPGAVLLIARGDQLAYLQAVGVVNDHTRDCFLYRPARSHPAKRRQ